MKYLKIFILLLITVFPLLSFADYDVDPNYASGVTDILENRAVGMQNALGVVNAGLPVLSTARFKYADGSSETGRKVSGAGSFQWAPVPGSQTPAPSNTGNGPGSSGNGSNTGGGGPGFGWWIGHSVCGTTNFGGWTCVWVTHAN